MKNHLKSRAPLRFMLLTLSVVMPLQAAPWATSPYGPLHYEGSGHGETWTTSPSTGSSQTQKFALSDKKIQADVQSAAKKVLHNLEVNHWVPTRNLVELKKTLNEIIVGRFKIMSRTDDAVMRMGPPDYILEVNREIVGKLSIDEIEDILAHEPVHKLVRQRLTMELARLDIDDLPKRKVKGKDGKMHMILQAAKIAGNPALEKKFLEALAYDNQNELEAYQFEIQYRARKAKSKSMTLDQYLRFLAKHSPSRELSTTYGLTLSGTTKKGELNPDIFRFIILHDQLRAADVYETFNKILKKHHLSAADATETGKWILNQFKTLGR